jgi:hypothetical protein
MGGCGYSFERIGVLIVVELQSIPNWEPPAALYRFGVVPEPHYLRVWLGSLSVYQRVDRIHCVELLALQSAPKLHAESRLQKQHEFHRVD